MMNIPLYSSLLSLNYFTYTATQHASNAVATYEASENNSQI